MSSLRLGFLALCAQVALAVTPIEVKGGNFVNSATGNKFEIIGVAYQPGGSSGYNPGSGVDPLSDGDVCLRDAVLMQQLGVNAIRVYNVDPDLNHDLCASIFNLAGIYMLLDVNSPLVGESIDRSAPWTSYYAGYLNRTFAVVEAFKNYPNTLLFFSGNEIINDANTSQLDPQYIRAVTRDLKNYVAKHSNRSIPVGYSAADYRDALVDTWNYMQCSLTGDDADPSRIDIFGLNSYSWCGDSSFTISGYDGFPKNFTGSSVPVFFSEYGCNVPYPRVFTEVQSIFGPDLLNTLAGGLVYEYSQEPSNYGLVTINSNGSVQLRGDYDTLQKQYNALNVANLESAKPLNTTAKPPKCEASIIQTSFFSKNFTLPDVPPGAQDIINNGVKPAPSGRIVTVTNLKVKQVVQDSKGNILTGLTLKALSDNQSNTPNGTTTSSDSSASSSSSSSSTTSSAPSSTSSHKNAGGRVEASRLILITALIGLGLMAL